MFDLAWGLASFSFILWWPLSPVFRFREIGGLHADRVDEASRDLVLGVGCSWHRDHA